VLGVCLGLGYRGCEEGEDNSLGVFIAGCIWFSTLELTVYENSGERIVQLGSNGKKEYGTKVFLEFSII
jgi:hypothetical protein